MNMQRIPTEIVVPDGKSIRVSTYNSNTWVMRFRALGIKNSRQPESIDAIEYICKFTKSELFLFREVYRHTEEDNSLTLRPKSYTPAEQAMLKIARPLWIKKKLLKRLKREYYIVSPWFLPPRQEQQKVMDYWGAIPHK